MKSHSFQLSVHCNWILCRIVVKQPHLTIHIVKIGCLQHSLSRKTSGSTLVKSFFLSCSCGSNLLQKQKRKPNKLKVLNTSICLYVLDSVLVTSHGSWDLHAAGLSSLYYTENNHYKNHWIPLLGCNPPVLRVSSLDMHQQELRFEWVSDQLRNHTNWPKEPFVKWSFAAGLGW